jgi:predicted TIM-barrel fold metal-dependent hydrolase
LPDLADLKIIDVDSHISEPFDLWTSRAPAAWRDRMPRIETRDGLRHWVVDRDTDLGRAWPVSVVNKDGSKCRGLDFFGWSHEEAHPSSFDMNARLGVLDRFGIHAQVLYPNLAGFGNQAFVRLDDQELRRQCAIVYNDAMAEIQANSGSRLLPMALMPWWNISESVDEVCRAKALGLRGIVMCSDPDTIGMPDLGDDAWTPFWEVCADLSMPVNFHIGASDTAFNMYGRAAWPSMRSTQKRQTRRSIALGSAALFFENARVLGNLICSGVLDRHPGVKVVSVESGIGWIPFMLESLDYEWFESGSQAEYELAMPPSAYFRRQVFGCFWFEMAAPTHLVDVIGEDNLMFETDYPHPTCLYPGVPEYLAEVTKEWSESQTRKILQDNAAQLYGLDLDG